MPSIATEYVRNRAQHDKTAKHWTELYARPGSNDAPSPPPPTTAPTQTLPGLYFNMPIFPAHLLPSRRTRTAPRPPVVTPPPATSEPIEIEDSDEDTPGPSGSSSTRAASGGGKRKRDEQPASDRGAKRGRPSDSGASSSRSGEVIVIED